MKLAPEAARRLEAHGVDLEAVGRAAERLVTTIRCGGKLLIFGNGGSAADAQHLAAELVVGFEHDRAPLPAVALTTDASALTAIGNDLGFEHVFERQLLGLAERGDAALGITTSGASANVLAALRAARRRGLTTIALTGATGAALKSQVDVVIAVPETNTARIQEAHLVVEHALCEAIETALLDIEHPSASARRRRGQVIPIDELLELRANWREEGRQVVFTNGCFDVLHVGHVRSLDAAASLGEVLVVGLNDDDAVRRLKGPGRPLMPETERAELLAALAPVDYVVTFSEEDPSALLERLQPDIHAKGEDYAPPNGKPLPEREVVEGYGGRIEFLPLVQGRSTSALVAAMPVTEHAGVFLDRDGTLMDDVGYPRDPESVRLLPGASGALRRLREHGLRLVVVSNQSGIGRGLVTQAEADAVHARFVELLAREGVTLDEVRYCPHAPIEGCDCRKPSPRLVLDAAAALELDLARSWFVGDKVIDVETGRRAGCGRLLLLGEDASAADGSVHTARDWGSAAELILGEERPWAHG